VSDRFTDCLERGETVKLSAFGSFLAWNKGPPRPDPEGRGPVPIPPCAGEAVAPLA
jgi:hypothetical protein